MELSSGQLPRAAALAGVLTFVSGVSALGMSTPGILADPKDRPEAFELEEARGLQAEIVSQEEKLKERADSLARSLSETLTHKLNELGTLSGEVDRLQHIQATIQKALEPEYQQIYRTVLHQGDRKNTRQQWLFLALSSVIGLVLGFAVNWLSNPLYNSIFH